MAKLPPTPKLQFLDSVGAPVASGTVSVYNSNSTRLATIYTNSSEAVEQSNPLTLDASGRGSIWIQENSAVKITVKNSKGSTLYTVDSLENTTDNRQLSGQLDTDGNSITSNANLNVTISPSGTGKSRIDDVQLTSDMDLNTNSITDSGGDVTVTHGTSNSLLLNTSSTTSKMAVKSDNANTVTLQSPASLSSSISLTLPSADGTSGQLLTSNGSGALSFTDGGNLTLIEAGAGSSPIQIDNVFTSTYSSYLLVLTDIYGASSFRNLLQFLNDTTAATASTYYFRNSILGSSYTTSGTTSSGTHMYLHDGISAWAPAGGRTAFQLVWIHKPTDATTKTNIVTHTYIGEGNGAGGLSTTVGYYDSAEAHDGVLLTIPSGNLDYQVYGIG